MTTNYAKEKAKAKLVGKAISFVLKLNAMETHITTNNKKGMGQSHG
jgi:hypothetical protein